MRTPPEAEQGIVAILDALGAASYGQAEIQRFIDSRQLVLQLLEEKAEDILGEIPAQRITTFTFNDTILIVFRTGPTSPNLQQISNFFQVMRKFFVDSLVNGILFRGSVAVGQFYANDATSTVMGQAVTDAAAWYDKADWVGVHATPRASLIIQHRLERSKKSKEWVIVDYNIPLKGEAVIRAKALNWPKAFFLESISPGNATAKPREKLLELLTQHQIPLGTESKFFNTLSFFDFVVKRSVRKGR